MGRNSKLRMSLHCVPKEKEMEMSNKNVRGSIGALFVILIAALFAACGGSSGGGDTSSLAPSTSNLAPPAARTVVGIVDAGTAPLAGALSDKAAPSAMM